MNGYHRPTSATLALVTLAEIKAATERFDRGDTNVFDTLDEVIVVVEAFQASGPDRIRREAA